MREISLDEKPAQLPINTFLMYGPSGCISGDAFIPYSVRTRAGELQNKKGGTLARLFHRFHRVKFPGMGSYQRKQTIDSEFWCSSMTEGGRIFHNKIVDVIDSGVRDCVRIRTVGGYELICTPDHPIATDETEFGFRAASELIVGSTILMHKNVRWTPEAENAPRVNRPEVYVKHHPHAPTKIVRDVARGYEHTYKRLMRARAVYEANMNGLSLEEFVSRLNDGRLDGLSFLSNDVDVHHKDENKLNDVPENLVALSHAEHAREHFILPNGRIRIGSCIAVNDVVSSVEPIGAHQTYDVKMVGPFHNFVADGFIVHNSGKTRWAASFPRPLFLSDATEQGWETIKYMDEAEFFEPGVKPIVWGVEQMNDMAICIERAKPLIAAKRVLTVVVDSISFYSDLYLNYLFALQTKQDNRAAYGALGTHLRDLRVKLHGLGVNVVWLALVRNPEENDPTGGPQIPGQQGGKFMAGTNFVLYTRVEQKKEGGKVVARTHEIRTMDYGPYIARNRLGGQGLPDPFVGTYTDLLAARGFDPAIIKKNLPAMGAMPVAQGSTAAPIAKPPVTIVKPTSGPKIVTVPPANNSAPKPAIPPQGTAHKGR